MNAESKFPAVGRLMSTGFFLAGFSLLSLEILWGRMTALTLGSSIHSYTITLASVMGGIFAGSRFGGLRSAAAHPPPAVSRPWDTEFPAPDTVTSMSPTFFFFLLFYSIAALLATFALLYLSDAMFFVKFHLPLPFGVSFYLMYVLVFFLIFIPSFFAGAVFPIAVQQMVRSASEAGLVTARLYMLNTLGAVAGSLLTGFVFAEFFGLKYSAMFCGILPGIPAIGYFLTGKTPGALLPMIALFSLAGGGCALAFPVFPFSIYIQGRYHSPEEFFKTRNNIKLVKSYENRFGIVKVLEEGQTRFLNVDGKNESSLFNLDFPTQSMLAYLPFHYHPNSGAPLRFLNIGLGTGTTVRIASTLVHQVDCVEINPAVYDAVVECFFPDIDKNMNVRYIFKEARHFLLLTDSKYDMISMEPSYPTDVTTASLLTRECFLSLKDHLNADGIVCVYAPWHLLKEHYTDGVLKTLAGVFPYLHVWNVGAGDVIFICALNPIRTTPEEIKRKIAEENLGSAMKDVIRFAKRNDMIETIRQSKDIPVYTDDRVILETAASREFVLK